MSESQEALVGDVKDSKKMQADRAARKRKAKDEAKRTQPDTTSGKGSEGESVSIVTRTESQSRRKSGAK